jgi:hypothetical protein
LVQLDHDVATDAINSPTVGIEGYDTDISVDVVNFGLNIETFDDSTKIWQMNKNTMIFEDFSNPADWDGANPPVNVAGTWAIIDSGSVPGTWNYNDWHQYYLSSWGDFARVHYSPAEVQNEWLITPSLDMTSAANAHLTFKHFYNDYTGTTDTAWVLITTDDWAHVNVVAMYTSDQGTSSSPLTPDYDITAWAAGSSNVKIAFKYVADDDLYWYLDNVEVYEVLAPTLVYSGGETVTALTSLETRTVDYTTPFADPDPGDYLMETLRSRCRQLPLGRQPGQRPGVQLVRYFRYRYASGLGSGFRRRPLYQQYCPGIFFHFLREPIYQHILK